MEMSDDFDRGTDNDYDEEKINFLISNYSSSDLSKIIISLSKRLEVYDNEIEILNDKNKQYECCIKRKNETIEAMLRSEQDNHDINVELSFKIHKYEKRLIEMTNRKIITQDSSTQTKAFINANSILTRMVSTSVQTVPIIRGIRIRKPEVRYKTPSAQKTESDYKSVDESASNLKNNHLIATNNLRVPNPSLEIETEENLSKSKMQYCCGTPGSSDLNKVLQKRRSIIPRPKEHAFTFL